MEDLAKVFHDWLQQQPSAINLVVVGGGAIAEQIRELDHRFQLGDKLSHELAVQAMNLNTSAVRHLLGGELVLDLNVAIANGHEQLMFVEPITFLSGAVASTRDLPLPENWNLSSDSISAQVAVASGAFELVLLKSALPVDCSSWQDASSIGFVDLHFPRAIQDLRNVRCVDLRDPRMPQWCPAAL
jgi:aspartokinase-like uncharacterized kinase